MRGLVLKAAGITLAIIVVAAVGIVFWLRTSLPKLDGEIHLSGLHGPVEIVRDEHAVPHIYAQTPHDAFFAIGFLHAQDRLWQMEMNRRIAAGRLSEVVGKDGVATDGFLRTLGVYRAAQQAIQYLDSDSRAMLDAYSAGVNAFLDKREGPLPPEFILTRHSPEPWTNVDSVAWLKMMAWDLSGNWRDEAARLDLLTRLGKEKTEQFMPPYPGDAPHDLPDLANTYPGIDFMAIRDGEDNQASADLPVPEPGLGSNNWVINGSFTKSGKPLLANDPHLGLTTPSVWYLLHVHLAGRDFVGATLPAIPFIVLGRNDTIAWGFTNTSPDVQDLFIERLSDDSGLRYETETGKRDFLIRQEVIKVRDGEDITIRVRESRHGPILSDASGNLRDLMDDRHVIAFQWTALEPRDTTLGAGRKVLEAKGWDDIVNALTGFHVPEQNIVYADTQGNIGYIAPGKVPIRHPESITRGLIPARGWMGKDEWIGQIPFEDLPQIYNPPSGVVVTANQKIVPPDYPYHITFDWALPYRSSHIQQKLLEERKHDVESFKAIQVNARSTMAVEMKEALLSQGAFGTAYQDVRTALASWDGDMLRERFEPLIYAYWHRAFARLAYSDELGSQFMRYWAARPEVLLPMLRGENGYATWCDNINTALVETCAGLAAQALDEAMAEASAEYGEDWRKWRWGDAHIIIQTHRPFSNVPVLKNWFEIRMEGDGGHEAINVSPFRFSNENPFHSSMGPSYRAIYDLADLDVSRYVIPTGQSGNPFSPHYDDLAPLWRDGQFIMISTKRADIEKDAIGTLRLKPES